MPHFDRYGDEEWVCQRGAHVRTGHSTWVEGLGNVCDECMESFTAYYTVRYNESEELSKVAALSLAELANKVRGKADRVRVWSARGVQLVDTKFGDAYDLVRKAVPHASS